MHTLFLGTGIFLFEGFLPDSYYEYVGVRPKVNSHAFLGLTASLIYCFIFWERLLTWFEQECQNLYSERLVIFKLRENKITSFDIKIGNESLYLDKKRQA